MIGHIPKREVPIAGWAGVPATAAIPWHIWCYVAAVASAAIGVTWDISWHMTIGRDTFWTPPHMFIYLCGVLGGGASAYLILIGGAGATVRMWGFHGPLGAFLAAWGAVAMLSSAPYDDWWHNAYGLDTKILSPPHMVLALGLLSIRFGALLLTLAGMNRASGELKRKLTRVFLFLGTMVLGITVGTFQELTLRNYMHSARFYLILALAAPVVLVAVREASRHQWGATICAGIMFCFQLSLLWILPLFSAEPKLGPVYQQVAHFIPQPFPLLIVAGAVALDLLRSRFQPRRPWIYAAAAGPVFLVVFLAVQWPFADFLMSPASRNWVFGAHYNAYFIPPSHDLIRNAFSAVETSSAQFWSRMAMALLGAVVSARLGLAWGRWMSRIRR
ncbi:MAG: hypothetical protein HY235_07395 [Acidobacteria bacterium]|nr:hypothetical protein [Acidobacteriota bacterium]